MREFFFNCQNCLGLNPNLSCCNEWLDDLSADIEQPPGIVAQGEFGLAFLLQNFFYGLKQPPRAVQHCYSRIWDEKKWSRSFSLLQSHWLQQVRLLSSICGWYCCYKRWSCRHYPTQVTSFQSLGATNLGTWFVSHEELVINNISNSSQGAPNEYVRLVRKRVLIFVIEMKFWLTLSTPDSLLK